MWIAPVDKSALEEALFNLLLSVCDGRPRATQPLVVNRATLRALYKDTNPVLQEALRHCLDAFLVELGPDPAQWGKLDVPVSVLGVALAVHNCLAPAPLQQPGEEEKNADPVADFTSALVATLPPARNRDTVVAYHAILRGSEATVPNLEPTRSGLMHDMIDRSPLTALWALDVHMPIVLDDLADELLYHWHSCNGTESKIWRDLEEWLNVVVGLVDNPKIVQWLQRRWLNMPETCDACRNLGLLLEALRRREDSRDFILRFYEAYDYFCAQRQGDGRYGQIRIWPVLRDIEKLLHTPGDSEAAIKINRRGNESFLKFRPLVELIIAEGGIPADYRLLSSEFVGALRPLLNYITEGRTQRIQYGEVTFEEENE